MKNLLLLFLFASSLVFADYGDSTKYPDTSCSLGNRTLVVDGVVQSPTYAASHTAENAARALSQRIGKQVIVRTPDMICSTVWRNNPTLSSASSSSVSSVSSSSRSSSGAQSTSSCAPTVIVPNYRFNSLNWTPGSEVNLIAGTTVELGPRPYNGAWSWSGCGITSTVRDLSLSPAASCRIVVTHTNNCGARSTQEYVITVSGQSGSQSSSSRSSSRSSQSSSVRSITVTWGHPTQRQNGDALSVSEIGGYEIRRYVGSSAAQIVRVGVVTSAIVPAADRIAIAAIDSGGLYSDFVDARR